MATDEKPGLPRTEEVALLASEKRSVDELAGTILLDRYRLQQPLGEGGAAVVYRAEHTIMHKPLAVKILRPENAARPDFVRRFLSEARTVARLRHENIVDVVDIGRTESGLVFCVMEWLEGEDLGETIDREGPMPWRRAKRIVLQICRALVAAHAAGIIHRDIKPQNCFRIRRGTDLDMVKVLDFGIAKDVSAEHKLTVTGVIMGTAGYMPPEQARGVAVDVRADVYAVGAVLFELLTGRPVFEGNNFLDVMMLQATAPAPRLSASVHGLPYGLDDLVACALARDREDRFAGMIDLATAVMNVGEAQPRQASSPVERAPVEAGGTVVAPPPRPIAPEDGGGATVVASPQAVPHDGSWPPSANATAPSPQGVPPRDPVTGPFPRRAFRVPIATAAAVVLLGATVAVGLYASRVGDDPVDDVVAGGEQPVAGQLSAVEPPLATPKASPVPAQVEEVPSESQPAEPSVPVASDKEVPHPDSAPPVDHEAELRVPASKSPPDDGEVNDERPAATRTQPSRGQARRRIRRACRDAIGRTKKVVNVNPRTKTVRVDPPYAPLKACAEAQLSKLDISSPLRVVLEPKGAP